MPARLMVGRLVQYTGSPGVGRIGEIDGERARVEFFESVAEPVAYSERVPLTECHPVALEPETRIYRRNPDTGDWLAGRVKAHVDSRYFVQFPNAQYHLPVLEDDLRVRWDRPVADPVTVLTAGGNESGYFHNARIPFLRNLVEQRAASASIPALLSSAVEIFPHQVRAALRVLSDPVQRYLLADEVGLGKTIQAGFIIRQTLLDHPDARICVLAPDVLRRQWVRELRDKFFIDDFPRATIKCLDHERPERWADYHHCDLVVVDEAHCLATDPDDYPYQALAALAHSCPRLLLLSATPVMSHHTTQLGLLHLLDPDLYRWTDRAAFERRHRLRSQLASCVHALDGEYTYLLPSAIEDIRALLPPADYRFAELCKEVLELLDDSDELRSDAEPAELQIRTEALRAHISETYRLHRRVIRHRRDVVLQDNPESVVPLFQVRGRQDPHALVTDSAGHDSAQVAVSDWRSRVWDHLLDSGLEERKSSYGMVLAILVSRGSVSSGDLVDALEWRIHGSHAAADSAGLLDREKTLLREPDVLGIEAAVLSELRGRRGRTDSDRKDLDDLIDTMLPALKRSRRTVLFCGPGTMAGSLTERLRDRFSQLCVCEHSRRTSPESAEEAVLSWSVPIRDYPASKVLVADDSAEDGLNLQMADAVVHVRLPWSPNQFEQRLGRADRYPGASQPGHAKILQYRLGGHDADESFLEAWAVLLGEGFRVFSESVSTLQDAISGELVGVWESALEYGPEGLTDRVAEVRKSLESAREEIDKMDLLEAVHEMSTGSRDVAGALSENEAAWRDTRAAMLGYVSRRGGIDLRHRGRTANGCEREIFDMRNSKPRLDPRRWRHAQYSLTEDMAQGAFNRSPALRTPGTRLLRLGHPLVDVLGQALHCDDRGQASAYRRIDSSHCGEPSVYFGFDYLVEADLTSALELVADQTEAMSALRRQADRLLPPFTLKVWIEAGAERPVTDARLLDWLGRPYDSEKDSNYNSEGTPGLLALFGGWDGYRVAAETAEQAARAHLAEATDLASRCDQAREQARQHVAVASAQALARKAAGHLVDDTESFLTDARVAESLVEALSSPAEKVIAATCIVRVSREAVKHRDSK